MEAGSAFDRLREAVRRVLGSVTLDGTKATDLGRAFELDYALAWQIHALSGQPDLHMTARVVPKPGAMERFLASAERLAPDELAREARTAYEAFEQAVTDLAGDREAFDAMLTLQRPEDAAGLRRLRRNAHRANAAVWGVMSRCKVFTTVFFQRPTGEFDSLSIYGYVGLQRLHPDATVSIMTSGWLKKDPSDMPPTTIPQNELIQEACSGPPARIEQVILPDGSQRNFLEIDGLGKRAEAQVFVRDQAMAIPGVSVAPPYFIQTTCKTPTELMLNDLLIPSDWPREDVVQAWMTSESGRDIMQNSTTRHRLPFEGGGRHLGTSFSALHSPAVPQYADLVRSEIHRMGWGETEFDIYRCEVQFPVLNSVVHLRVD